MCLQEEREALASPLTKLEALLNAVWALGPGPSSTSGPLRARQGGEDLLLCPLPHHWVGGSAYFCERPLHQCLAAPLSLSGTQRFPVVELERLSRLQTVGGHKCMMAAPPHQAGGSAGPWPGSLCPLRPWWAKREEEVVWGGDPSACWVLGRAD